MKLLITVNYEWNLVNVCMRAGVCVAKALKENPIE